MKKTLLLLVLLGFSSVTKAERQGRYTESQRQEQLNKPKSAAVVTDDTGNKKSKDHKKRYHKKDSDKDHHKKESKHKKSEPKEPKEKSSRNKSRAAVGLDPDETDLKVLADKAEAKRQAVRDKRAKHKAQVAQDKQEKKDTKKQQKAEAEKERQLESGPKKTSRRKEKALKKKIEVVDRDIERLERDKEELEAQEEKPAKKHHLHARTVSRQIESKESRIEADEKKRTRLEKKLSKVKHPTPSAEIQERADQQRTLMDHYGNRIDEVTENRKSTLDEKENAYHREHKRIQQLSNEDIEGSLKDLRTARYHHDDATAKSLERHVGMHPHDLKPYDRDLQAQSKERTTLVTSLKKAEGEYDKVAGKAGVPSRRKIRHEKLVAKRAAQKDPGFRESHYTNLEKEVNDLKEKNNS